jgi:hypothetical protein
MQLPNFYLATSRSRGLMIISKRQFKLSRRFLMILSNQSMNSAENSIMIRPSNSFTGFIYSLKKCTRSIQTLLR